MPELPPLPPAAPGSFAGTLVRRRTVRDFAERPITAEAAGQLLWAAQGLVDGEHRTTPSAGGLYPLSVALTAGNVDGISPGVYHYEPTAHRLLCRSDEDPRGALRDAAIDDQPWLATAPAVLVLTADIDRATDHFADQPPHGRRGERYAYIETGHAAQNVYLQATALGLGTVLVGGFDETRLVTTIPALCPAGHRPTALLPVGHPAGPRSGGSPLDGR